MSYTIVITKTETVKKLVGKEWAVLGTEECKRSPDLYTGQKGEPKTYMAEKRGYTPEIEKSVEVTTKVFEQTVKDMTLAHVIKAVNGLP